MSKQFVKSWEVIFRGFEKGITTTKTRAVLQTKCKYHNKYAFKTVRLDLRNVSKIEYWLQDSEDRFPSFKALAKHFKLIPIPNE